MSNYSNAHVIILISLQYSRSSVTALDGEIFATTEFI